MYPYVIFDLDGTLLNTIDDLANAGNHVCRLHGWPTHSVDEFKRMVGNGIPKLVERFAPEGTGAPVLEQALGEFMAWYGVHKADQTAPYPGMLQAVRRLKEAGVSIAVLSNKADEMAGPVVEGYYPQIFPLVQGALTGIPTKPDPTLLHRLMERMGASQENTLFVGDSNVDIQTAKNGGLTSCGVLWGFRSRQELEQEGADYLASTPEDLLTLILGEKGGRETRHLGPEDVEEAAAILRSGGLVGIPTETVYGLGANGLNPEAVAHIFEAKGRPQDNPLILHIPSADHLERYCADIPQSAFDLARACWPGPLTMILKRRPIVPDVVTAGMDTVGMRCPSHPVCRAILQAAEVPVAAPSGNTSGRLVAARIKRPLDVSMPSISESSWFKVCCCSDSPPPLTPLLLRPMESISSIKMIHGEFCCACLNKLRTREAPTPTYISIKSEPDRKKNGTSASPATALASRVLPVPGGPTSRAPFGSFAPMWVYLPGL